MRAAVMSTWTPEKWAKYSKYSGVILGARFRVAATTVQRWRRIAGVKNTSQRRARTVRIEERTDWAKYVHLDNTALSRILGVSRYTLARIRPEPYPRSRRGPKYYDYQMVEQQIMGALNRFTPTRFSRVVDEVRDYYPEICDRTVRRTLYKLVEAGRVLCLREGTDSREWGYLRNRKQ